MAGHEQDEDVQTLTWFSNNYYAIHQKKDGTLQYNDLRFGTLNSEKYDPKDFVFHFILEEKEGILKASERQRGGAPEEGEEGPQMSDLLGQLWERIKGI